MPILEGDIRLLASQVMTDTDQGGGAATGVVIVDGASNNIFPDVSELDHVYGRVSLRKVFVGVNTADTDTYLGANVIVAKPPTNPDVSAVLFSTADDFDQRAAAATRIESYLAAGPSYAGYLFGDHIAGQMTVSVQQRTSIPLPSNGDTLVLVKFPGAVNEFRQFVRVTDVAATDRDFTDSSNGLDVNFTRSILSLTISQALEQDFPGFDAIYQDATVAYDGKTEILGSVVADAAKYYGVVPLTAAAAFGDFGVTGDGIYAQLVPSSRTETAIADARMNQQLDPLIATGVNVDVNLSVEMDATHVGYVGGGVLPGTLIITDVGSGARITDKGGNMIDATGNNVGAIDYANGLVALSTSALGAGADAKRIQYSRAAAAAVVGNSIGLDVTEDTRRLTWVVSLTPVPAKGSLTASYLSQGHWYELTDDGSGALRGSDVSFGAGVLNFTTGTLSLTLGALPDAPSSIILQWADSVAAGVTTPNALSPTNTSIFALEEIDMGAPFSIGSLTVTWGAGKTANDATSATISGDADGIIDYTTGKVQIAPHVLPAPGTVMTATVTHNVAQAQEVLAFTSSGSNWTFTLAAGVGIAPRSLKLATYGSFPAHVYPGSDQTLSDNAVTLHDDGVGNIIYSGCWSDTGEAWATINVGTINYATGACVLQKTIAAYHTIQPTYGTVYPLGSGAGYIKVLSNDRRDVPLTVQNGRSGGVGAAAEIAYATTGTGLTVVTKAFADPAITTLLYGAIMSASTTFTYGGKNYLALPGGDLVMDVNASTGVGTVAGSWTTSGTITITNWTTGATSLISAFSATASLGTAVTDDSSTTLQLTDGITFRTATAPIAPEGFQVIGTTQAGGAFNVTADGTGNISGSGVYGTINYNTGVVSLRFGNPTTDAVSSTVMNIASYGLPGVTNIALSAVGQDSLRYNAVAYNYIPLDPTILGLDPVRLPSDGRVPIFKKGGVAVVHYTHALAPATYANGNTVDLGNTRLSVVTVVGNDGVTITTGYTPNLDTGHVIVDSISGWSQPVTMSYRIEDMALITDAQISGQIQLSRALSHAYPLGSYVSSAFLVGDMQSSVETLFEQQTWTGVWQDTPIGSAILAAYDQVNHPPVVTNAGAVTESWALIFTSTTAFSIVGEHLGVVGVGSTATECAPLNPNSATPYFSLASTGFGLGWATGNVIRINTVGALAPLWLARVVQQGDNTLDEDSFTVLVRGDVNA